MTESAAKFRSSFPEGRKLSAGFRSAVWKHGGKWEGIVPQLLSSFKKTASGPRRLQLEKYMRVVGCATCRGIPLPAGKSLRRTR